MLTQENKNQIKKIIQDHLSEIDILKIDNYDLTKKAQTIHKELPSIYKKIDAEKLLPEGMDFNNFMNLATTYLNQAYQEAQFGGFFRVF
jgi:hypothetical protein